MGRARGGGFLNATNKEEAMREGYADACDFAFYNVDRHEDPSGSYNNSFRFYDKCFDTEEDAEDFFKSLGDYVDGVCMVKQASKSASNKYQKTMTKIREKQQAIKEKAIERFKERTSETIGCKECGTRITKEVALQRKLICPKCRNWLVSNTTKAQYNKYEEAKELAEKQLVKDTAETGKPRYWAKYEVHT